MSIVSVKNVTKDYLQGKIKVSALQGVNLEIEKGEFLAIAGPSGSGKTTLLNCIGGLDDVSGGTITLGGTDISGLSPKQLAKIRLHDIGFIFQSYNLIPVLTALENVEFVLLLQGVSPKDRHDKAIAILKAVGLEDQINRRPTEMSGGQQQRVAVARAIVPKPKIILADEPTANLDSKTGAGLLDMMRSLNEKEGVTFIFSTHDNMVMDYSKRLVLLKDGKVDSDVTR